MLPVLSKRSRNALAVVATVACPAQSMVTTTTHEIALHLGFSMSYLEGLLRDLRALGVLLAYRGPGGGYRLAKDPQAMSVWEVVGSFEKYSPTTPAAGSGQAAISWLEGQSQQLQRDFLEARRLSELVPEVSTLQVKRQRGGGTVGFKPLPPPLMPRAPNSVFDLPAFQALSPAPNTWVDPLHDPARSYSATRAGRAALTGSAQTSPAHARRRSPAAPQRAAPRSVYGLSGLSA